MKGVRKPQTTKNADRLFHKKTTAKGKRMKMEKIRKQLAVAVTIACLAFPLSSALAQTATSDTQVVVASTITSTTVLQAAEAAVATYEAGPLTTLHEVVTAESMKAAAITAVAAVDDVELKAGFVLRITNRETTIETAKTALMAEAEAEVAVTAYEAAPITTLEEIATVEALKATAVTEVAAVTAEDKNDAFELRIANRTTAVATQKAALQVGAAEVAVAAYEAAPMTTLAEVATAEGLKTAAVTAVAAVVAEDKKTAFILRITTREEVISAAKAVLIEEVIDEDGNEVTPATWFSDFINELQLALAYDPARKCQLNKWQALKKLAQAHKCIKEGNVEASEVCLNQYTDKIAKAQAFLLEVEDPATETAKTLATALENVEANNIQVLGNLVDKLPPQAAQKLALNVVRTMEKAVDRIEKEEAKVAPVTPVVTPVSINEAEKKIIKKQAKVALAEFKKSINEKGKLHIEVRGEDQDQDNDQIIKDKNIVKQTKPEQKKSEQDLNFNQVAQRKTINVTIVPAKKQTAPIYKAAGNNKSENNKDNQNKKVDSKKYMGEDKRQNHN